MADPIEALVAQKSALDLRAAIVLLRKRKWMIIAISAIVPALVGTIVSRQRPVYEASASIIIDVTVPQYLGANFRDVVEIETSWWSARENLETEFRILRSDSQATATAKALCEQKFGPRGEPAIRMLSPDARCDRAADIAAVARQIQGSLKIEPAKESRIVNLTVLSPDPGFAALLANTLVKIYVERNLERRLAQSQHASSWLGNEYGDLGDQLRTAETALVTFKRQNNIVSVSIEDDQNDLSLQRKKIASELTTIEVNLITLRAQRDMLSSVRSSDPIAEFDPALADSPIAGRLKEAYMEQYLKLLELRGKYLEKHPLVVTLETRLQAIKADLLREIAIGKKNVDLKFQTLTKQASDLRTALNTATKRALELETRVFEYSRLKRDLDRLLKLTEQVGGREQETSLASHLRTNNVRMLDAARPPTSPVSPDVRRATGIAALVAVLVALGLAVVLESLDNTVKTQEDLERTVGVTFLGLIPSIEPAAMARGHDRRPSTGQQGKELDPDSKDTFVWTNPNSTVAECCRSIRTNLLFASPDRPSRTLLITSAGPQEGKTTVAVNLAITLAQSGLSVLLVDTDMRRPRLHRALGVPAIGDGLSKAIVGECEVLSAVRDTGIPRLQLLPCGPCPPNPAELLHAERFKRIVAQLVERYDRVIFDSPPIGVVTDPVILSRLTDGTVFVAKAGRTSRDALSRANRQLVGSDSRANVLGCIINDLDIKNHNKYGYYYYQYYSRYGNYYGTDKTAVAGASAPSA
jgi:polysaccharide biosynthesis transport protein